MARAYIPGKTLDDVMRSVIKEIQERGARITPSKGSATELTGVLLEVLEPRARLSRTETRGKPFSCLGELCWYLAGKKDLQFISYYLKDYEEFADGDEIYGGYGPRLFDWEGLRQFANVRARLMRSPVSRKAVIQLFDGRDIIAEHKDVPCTSTLQFMIRGDKLHMFTNMRSNDVYKGLPHDVFSFTMLQEIMARDLCVELGTYKHAVGSLHLYDTDQEAAQQFLDEGYQPTNKPMPAMPKGDPWPAIAFLLKAEAKIRTYNGFERIILDGVDPYWADLIRLLQVFRCKKNEDAENIKALRAQVSFSVYYPFIDRALMQLQ